MKGVVIHKNSPYYWLRYYDKLEQDPDNRRKWLNTKIEVLNSDRKRKERGQRLIGTSELRRLVDGFRTGLAEKIIESRSGVRLKMPVLLSEGYAQFKYERTVEGTKKQLKPKTINTTYEYSVKTFIEVCRDRYIYTYNYSKDFLKFCEYMAKMNLSQNTKSIYSRTLHSLWNWFIEKKYCQFNPIEVIEPLEKEPQPIPTDDLITIIDYFRANQYQSQYHLVYFLLLTGCRPSSAMVQLKEDIDFKGKVLKIRNVKTGKQKSQEYYLFPLYKELYKLLHDEMGIREGDTGRVFAEYSINELNYTDSLKFFRRRMRLLITAKQIRKEYSLKHLRPSFASYLVDVMEMDSMKVKKLLDHTDIKITEKHYIKLNLNSLRKQLDEFSLDYMQKTDFENRKYVS